MVVVTCIPMCITWCLSVWDCVICLEQENRRLKISKVNPLFVLVIINRSNTNVFVFPSAGSITLPWSLWRKLNARLLLLVPPHSDPSLFTYSLLSGRRVAQGPRKKWSQHGGVKGEENPPPTTVRTHFRLGLHVKSHSPGTFGGWRRIHCFGMGQWVCAIKNRCSYKCLRLLNQVAL